MSNLEKFTDVVSVAFEPYFGTPLIFDENKPAVPLWTNYLFINGALHYGHLEMFRSEKIEVIHANFYAHPLIDAPDLGFDVIWLNGKCTGYFFDYSNNNNSDLTSIIAKVNERIANVPNRDIPAWATTFSPHAILKRPESEDQVLELFVNTVPLFGSWAAKVNVEYQKLLDERIESRDRIYNRNKYIDSLRSNPKTSMALTSLIGKEDTEHFMDNVLYRNLN